MPWTLTPIQLTATEYMRQPMHLSPLLPYTDASLLPTPFDGEDILGVHDICEGAMNLTQVSATTVAVACWTCGFRITVLSAGLVTYGNLRARTPAADTPIAGLVVLGPIGQVVVANTYVAATTKFSLTAQDGGPPPTGVIYQSARVVGTSFTIKSAAGAADTGVQVYYQLWEPTAP